MQAIVNQEHKQKEVKPQVSVDTKASVAPARKAEPREGPISHRRHESPEDYNSDKLKEFVQKQSMERLGLVNRNLSTNAKKHPSGNKANKLVSSVKGDTVLISFDDEPAAKTLAGGGGGAAPFADMNKVLLPTERHAYITMDKKNEGFNKEKKEENATSEKKGGFLEGDLLGDLL